MGYLDDSDPAAERDRLKEVIVKHLIRQDPIAWDRRFAESAIDQLINEAELALLADIESTSRRVRRTWQEVGLGQRIFQRLKRSSGGGASP